jgi:hypothetical protein
MTQVSLLHLYVLRTTCLLIVGLGIDIWPGIIHQEKAWQLMQGVVCCSLATGPALAVSGLRVRYRSCERGAAGSYRFRITDGFGAD